MLQWSMFLRRHKRVKDGKEHHYYSVMESRRLQSGKVAQRRVLYLGEINDSQQAAWRKTLEVFDEQKQQYRKLSLFAEDRSGAARHRCCTSEARSDAVAALAAIRELLVGMRVMEATGTGPLLGTQTTART